MSEATENTDATGDDVTDIETMADLYPMEVDLDSIQTDSIPNHRKVVNTAAVDNLAKSIYTEGLMQPPICAVVVELDADGDVVADSEGRPSILACHVVAGFQRVAAIRALKLYHETHNAAVANESIGEVDPNGYWFVDSEGAVITTEVEFNLDLIPVMGREVSEIDAEVIEWASRKNLVENLQRDNLNLGDEIDGVNLLLSQGMTQLVVSAATGKSQPTISQYKKIKTRAIPAVLEAIREGKLTLQKGLSIAALLTRGDKPDVRAQKAALGALLNKEGKAGAKDKIKTRRTQKEILVLVHSLDDPETFADVDPDRRAAIRDTFAWLFVGCDEGALVYGLRDEISLTANLPAPKEKKEKKAKPAKTAKTAKAKKGAGKKRRTPAQKTATEAPAAAEGEGTEAAAPAADAPAAEKTGGRRKRRRRTAREATE